MTNQLSSFGRLFRRSFTISGKSRRISRTATPKFRGGRRHSSGDLGDAFAFQASRAYGNVQKTEKHKSAQKTADSESVPGQVDDYDSDSDQSTTASTVDSVSDMVEDEQMHIKWSAALAGREVSNLDAEELNTLGEQGIPLKHRHALWKKWFTAPSFSADDVERLQGQVLEEFASQIDADVARTQPKLLGPAEVRSLRRVLRAYAAENPHVGYCQGMNNIAATFILLGFDEVESLRGCYTLLQGCCPGYHDRDLAGFRMDAQVLGAVADRVLPKQMLTRLEFLEVPVEVLVSEHFLSLASKSWPLSATARLWDLLFQEGSPALFASVIALMKLYLPEEEPNCADAVWDLEEPVDVFRASVAHGVATDIDTIIRETRELISIMPQTEINQIRFDITSRKR